MALRKNDNDLIEGVEEPFSFVEEPEPGISYGVKGMGELPHVQAPPAVLSALRAATGLALPAIPATAEMLAGIADSHPRRPLLDFETPSTGP